MAISQDAAPDAFEFHQRFGLSMPTLIDSGPRYSASNAYKITSVPSIFLVEVDGLIGSAFEGFNRKELEKLGGRFQTIPFRGNETVPDLRPG
jgi:hypothetical protein